MAIEPIRGEETNFDFCTIVAGSITSDTINYSGGQARRTFHWFRQSASLGLDGTQVVTDPSTGEYLGKITTDMIPMDEMHGPATYDTGGRFVVLETVLDLEYTIIDAETKHSVHITPLSLEEAKEYCDELNRIYHEHTPPIITFSEPEPEEWERPLRTIITMVVFVALIVLIYHAWGLL